MPVAITLAPVFGLYQRVIVQLLCQASILLQLQLCWCLLIQLVLLYVPMSLIIMPYSASASSVLLLFSRQLYPWNLVTHLKYFKKQVVSIHFP